MTKTLPPRTSKDAQLEAFYALAGTLAALEGRLTEMVSATRGLIVNGVLFSGTILLDADGRFTVDFPVPFGGVAVGNSGITTVTVHNDGPQISAPAQGTGVHKVAAGKQADFPLAGRALTLYGTAGAVVQLGVYDRPQHAADFAPDAAGTLTANDADDQGNFVGASAVDSHPYVYDRVTNTWDRAAGRSGVLSVAPAPAEPLVDSGTATNAVNAQALTPNATKRAYLTGFEVTANNPAAAVTVDVTVTGISDTEAGATTLTFKLNAATTGSNQLIVQLPTALKAAADGGAITVSCPALGVGGTSAVTVHGFQV